MEESTEELEPLFDYSRIQPIDFVFLDDDCSASPPFFTAKRKRASNPSVEGKVESCEVVNVDESVEEKEEDWLLPPPKKPVAAAAALQEDPTIQELRLKKQELALFAQSAEDVLRAVEESVKREISGSGKSVPEPEGDQPSKPNDKREKIVISIQDKDGLKQFRMFMDDKFERLFKMYAEKVKSKKETLVFCFDGDKVSSTATPKSLGLENDDIIEVHCKPN
ncbi:uncharacterized protein LOC131235120 [Magnolia sinica]|uniref:uncharacterized protein LOC131235120 n=1 Tax=Magnolia sinica TaxID=86752 RepID=UPI00265AEC7A|nr:uncharacterized protein LOC131235120 [Magnolia sinica]